MTTKRIGYTFWSNERSITEDGQCGVLHGRLFVSPEHAKRFYETANHSCTGDVLVKVTAEIYAPAGDKENSR